MRCRTPSSGFSEPAQPYASCYHPKSKSRSTERRSTAQKQRHHELPKPRTQKHGPLQPERRQTRPAKSNRSSCKACLVHRGLHHEDGRLGFMGRFGFVEYNLPDEEAETTWASSAGFVNSSGTQVVLLCGWGGLQLRNPNIQARLRAPFRRGGRKVP